MYMYVYIYICAENDPDDYCWHCSCEYHFYNYWCCYYAHVPYSTRNGPSSATYTVFPATVATVSQAGHRTQLVQLMSALAHWAL